MSKTIPSKPDLKLPNELRQELQAREGEESAQEIQAEMQAVETKQHYEIQLMKAQLEKFRDDNKGRRTFSEIILTIVIVWMFLVLLTVACTGMGHLHLSDGVLIALITTTTANVIAMLIIVVNYLFNKDKST